MSPSPDDLVDDAVALAQRWLAAGQIGRAHV